MSDYDLCLAWNWQYDADFVGLLTRACQAAGLSLFQVTPDTLEPTLTSLTTREICFRAFFDRASDADDRFTHLVSWARQLFAIRINRFWLARRAWDKASMYHQVLAAGLDSPATLALPPSRNSRRSNRWI